MWWWAFPDVCIDARPFYCEWLVIITFKPDVIEDHADKLDGEANKVYISWASHIVVSKKNQEEIFASLSKNDFKKIISNL